MSINDKAYEDEIDLLEWFQTIWDGKWKIASIMVVSLLAAFGFNIVNTTFIAQTEIKPITSFEFDKYRLFNATGVFEIKRNDLLNLYIEELEEGTLFEIGIEKFELLNEDDYENKDGYKEAIQKFASEIEKSMWIWKKPET